MKRFINHRKYIKSKDWLLKKQELTSIYLKEKWNIECMICKNTNELQVHHLSYQNLGNEILTDGKINELAFVCRDCHRKIHFENGFYSNWVKEQINNLFLRGGGQVGK